MIGELNIDGVFVAPLAVWAVVALGVNLMLRQVLIRVGLYRVVWHPALFDTALFVILWALVAVLSAHISFLLEPVR
jgi:protein-S-isoprenylcysteine O-methyltransferase Ste14